MPAAASSSLTLSEVQALDPEPLRTAARNWDDAATVWEEETDAAYRSLERADWRGIASEAALERSSNHRRVVFADAEQIRGAVKIANSGAEELVAAQQRILREVNDAIAAGFEVGEDFSVTYPADIGSAVTAAAKQEEAEAHAAEIRAAVANLVALDDSIAGSLGSAMAGFGDAPAGTGMGNGGGVAPAGFGPHPMNPPPPPPTNPAQTGNPGGGRTSVGDDSAGTKPEETKPETRTTVDDDPATKEATPEDDVDGKTTVDDDISETQGARHHYHRHNDRRRYAVADRTYSGTAVWCADVAADVAAEWWGGAEAAVVAVVTGVPADQSGYECGWFVTGGAGGV